MSKHTPRSQQLLSKISEALAESSPSTGDQEVIVLKKRIEVLEHAIRKAIAYKDGHAVWRDFKGNAYIKPDGYKLLKQALEET